VGVEKVGASSALGAAREQDGARANGG